MGNDFDPKDFGAPRRDIKAFFSGLNKEICDSERGYQAGLRGKAAAMLAAYYVLANDFCAFLEVIDHDCFANNKKVQSLDENNYHKRLPRIVVERSFDGSGAFPSTLSKFTTTLKHLVKLKVKPEACARTIKDAGGFKDFYEQAVEAKREGKAASGSGEKGSVPRARSRSADESMSDHTDDDQDCDEAASPSGTRAKASAETLTFKEICDNYLLVKMSKKELDQYRNGPFSQDDRRGLVIEYDGKGPSGLQEWVFVSELEVEAPDAIEQDNDNDADDVEDVA
ncbi:hypothetical protein [Methylobacterium aquaticum]|uniref:Uncharacterized protein n=1 Tax=Methylobacterium aquaticum TaxID=270351 RepID=A0A0C6F291_9HYPH|nr:hypothetical protein [Methylobacterium aquaticum]BAQ46716.1 hypothetical protein Maq22A_c18085 [Methylobacterium aquaticum]